MIRLARDGSETWQRLLSHGGGVSEWLPWPWVMDHAFGMCDGPRFRYPERPSSLANSPLSLDTRLLPGWWWVVPLVAFPTKRFGGTVGGNRATGGTARPIWRHGGTAAQSGGKCATGGTVAAQSGGTAAQLGGNCATGGTPAQIGGTAAQVGEPIVRREPIVRQS
eukprot:gene15234-biopygen8361